MRRSYLVRLAVVLAVAAFAANQAADPGRGTVLFRVLLWLTVLAILAGERGLGMLRRHPPETIRAALGVVAAFALAAHIDFGRFHGDGQTLHYHELYHYGLGSKYFPELGYDGHYLATHRALVDNDPTYLDRIDRVKNLRTLALESRNVSLQRSESVAARFTAERWDEFQHDIASFQRTVPPEMWRYRLIDHGYNPTPFWTMLGRAFTADRELFGDNLRLLASLDLFLLLGVIALAAWGFGAKAALLFGIFYLAGFPDAFAFVGGAFLRLPWLLGCVGFAACLRRDRPLLGGALLGIAVVDRIFPVLLLAAPLASIAHAALKGRRASRAAWLAIDACAATALALVVASGFAVGDAGGAFGWWAPWRDCLANITTHSSWFFANQVSLRTLFLVDLPATWEMVRSGWDDSVWVREREAMRDATVATLTAARVALTGAIGVVAAAWWAAGERERDADPAAATRSTAAIGLAGFLPFVLLYPAGYYFLFLGVAFLAVASSRRLVLALVAANALILAVRAWFWGLEQVELASWFTSLILLAALFAVLWPTRPRRPEVRLAAIVALVIALLGVGTDLVRASMRAPATTWDLAASDALSPGPVRNRGMATFGALWSRGDHVSIEPADGAAKASFRLDPPATGDGPVDVYVELTAAPTHGVARVSLGEEVLGEVDLFGTFAAQRTLVAQRLDLPSGGVDLVTVEVIGANGNARARHAAVDRVLVRPTLGARRDRELARDRALGWVLANPADLFDGGRKGMLRELVALTRLASDPLVDHRRAAIRRAADDRLDAVNALRGDWALTPEGEWIAAGAVAAADLGGELRIAPIVSADLVAWSKAVYAERSVLRASALARWLRQGAAPDLPPPLRPTALEAAGRELLRILDRPHDRRDEVRLRKLVRDVCADVEAATAFGARDAGPLELDRADLARLLGGALPRAVDVGDVTGVARMLSVTVWLDLEVEVDVDAFEDGIRFLLDQQRDDGSFGKVDPGAPNPEREAVLFAMLALAAVS